MTLQVRPVWSSKFSGTTRRREYFANVAFTAGLYSVVHHQSQVRVGLNISDGLLTSGTFVSRGRKVAWADGARFWPTLMG